LEEIDEIRRVQDLFMGDHMLFGKRKQVRGFLQEYIVEDQIIP